ncbi:TIGR03086 family metal-binding protein [Pseudonocardia xinjiangensis]|nr:TIGR03086 family metal-binding protein [Pseudonocardia xinjiangensis]
MASRLLAMTTSELTDPRPLYAGALSWAQDIVRGIRSDQLGEPTPCPEFDVRTLLAHLVATVDRATALGKGMDWALTPSFVPAAPDDGWSRVYGDAIAAMWAVWGDEADSGRLLDRVVTAPFGTVPGRAALVSWTRETLVHGWDLAVATGQDVEADPEAARAVLAMTERVLPAEPRGGHIPFASPVPPRADAGPTERLANWCGHRRP